MKIYRATTVYPSGIAESYDNGATDTEVSKEFFNEGPHFVVVTDYVGDYSLLIDLP